jgi:hypothetical protein
MTRPAAPELCPLCRRAIDGAAGPELVTSFIAVTPEQQMINVLVHVGCFVDTIAGRVQEAVLYAIQTGRVNVGLERHEGAELTDVISGLVADVLHRYARSS